MTHSMAGQPLTPEQEAFLRAQQAQQAAEQGTPIAAAQAETAGQMTERGPLLPAESQVDELMAALKAQSDKLEAMQAQLGTVQKQMEESQAAQGGPLVVRYAQGAADKLEATAAQWPAHAAKGDLLDQAREAAGTLVTAAKQIVKGDPTAAGAITKATPVITRLARKLPHVDWSAVLDDVEAVADEAGKFAA
jgi:hypothetical protein